MEKLYEENPFLTRFTARVRSCAQGRKGWDVILDQTAFYPEGGGQPYDLGTLGGVQVLEVHEREGHVVHTCSAPLEEGSPVEGEIDWARRFDLMQHHSGEHIVSGLAHAMYGCDNVGFHMGSDVITIDLNVELTPDQLRAAGGRRPTATSGRTTRSQITYPSSGRAGASGLPEQKGPTGPGAHRLLPRGGHLRLLRHPCVLLRTGGPGEAALLSRSSGTACASSWCAAAGPCVYLSQVWEQNHQISNLALRQGCWRPVAAVERLLEENARPQVPPPHHGGRRISPPWPSSTPGRGTWCSLRRV